MKEILVINQHTTQLFIDIINVLVYRGYSVTLLTGKVVPSYEKLSEEVRVKKLITYNRGNNLSRLTTWLIFTIQAMSILIVGKKKITILATNPPILPVLLSFLRRYQKGGLNVIYYDIYPDILVRLGILKEENIIVNVWNKLNSKLLNIADSNITISEKLASQLRTNSDTAKIDVVYCWTDTSKIKPIVPNKNIERIKYGLVDKFVVLFSGNFGASHSLITIIHVAKKLKDRKGIHFVFIGDGNKKDSLKALARKWELDNVLFLPWQPQELLPLTIALGDVGVVTLGDGIELLSVPSKTYFYLAAGIPILGVAANGSEVEDLVKKYSCGAVFENSEIEKIVSYLNRIKTDHKLYNSLKNSARSAASDFSISNASKIVEILNL